MLCVSGGPRSIPSPQRKGLGPTAKLQLNGPRPDPARQTAEKVIGFGFTTVRLRPCLAGRAPPPSSRCHRYLEVVARRAEKWRRRQSCVVGSP
jgi:hypothetical protein